MIGEGDCDHSRLEWHLITGSGSEDEAPQDSTAVLNKKLHLGSGEAHPIYVPDPATEQHMAVVFEAHHRAGPRV